MKIMIVTKDSPPCNVKEIFKKIRGKEVNQRHEQ